MIAQISKPIPQATAKENEIRAKNKSSIPTHPLASAIKIARTYKIYKPIADITNRVIGINLEDNFFAL